MICDPLGAERKLGPRSAGFRSAFLQADDFRRAVNLQAPPERKPGRTRRVWKFAGPAYGLNDTPIALCKTLRNHSLNVRRSTKSAGLRFAASAVDSLLYCIYRATGSAAGALATNIDDVPGHGEPGALPFVQKYLEPSFRALKLLGRTFAHVGMEFHPE